jgi:hypothetical protein
MNNLSPSEKTVATLTSDRCAMKIELEGGFFCSLDEYLSKFICKTVFLLILKVYYKIPFINIVYMVEEAISLIHRLVENLPEQVSYWDGPRDQIDDLENFAGFNDSEIEKIRNLLQSTERVSVEPHMEAFSQAMVGMLEEEEDSDYIPPNFTKNGTFAVDSTLRSKAIRDFRFNLMDSRVTGIFQTEIQTEQFEKIEFYQEQVF